MKRIVTLLAFSLCVITLFAQRGKVTTALSYKESGEILKAYQAIQEAIDSTNVKTEKSITWPRTWEARGQILQEAQKKGVTGLVPEPLFAAYDSYIKAINYDKDSKFSKSIIIDLTFLQTDLSNYAIASYNSQKYDISLKCFEYFLAINSLPLMNQKSGQAVVDTAIVYNAGLAAYKAKNWDKAVEYFTQSAKLDYNGPSSYNFACLSYKEKGDTLNYITTLKQGFQTYPADETLMVELINFYISKGKSDDAIKYIDMAISQKPQNASLYTAKGSMLEKLGKVEDAIILYKKSIEIDSTQFAPYYNLSVIYYNRGVETVNSANQIPPSQADKYEAEIQKANEHFRLSLPYIEKAYSIQPNEIAILESLKTVYYRLQMNDKYLEVNKKIQSLKQQ